jgi:hypothetical protein
VIAHWLVLPVEKVATKVQSLGFISISIEMAKIVVGSPSLTQPLLLYPGLGPTMLDNIDATKVQSLGLTKKKGTCLFSCGAQCPGLSRCVRLPWAYE